MMEQTSFLPLGQFLHREVGLTPDAIRFDLNGDVLTVRLTHALTPMAGIIAREEAGVEIVQGAYEALITDCHAQFEQMASEITGFPVRYSRIAVDAPTEDVTVEFLLQSKGDVYG